MRKQISPLYTILCALALLVLGAFLVGWAYAGAAGTGASAVGDGRYRMMTAGGGTSPYVYLLDTHTGRCWIENSPGEAWREVTLDMTAPRP